MKKRVLSLIKKHRLLSFSLILIFITQLSALASDVTYSTAPVAAANILQGSIDNPVYSFKIVAGATDVTLDNMQVTTAGTYTAADIDGFNVYVNSTNSVAGASFVRANFAATTGNGETILFNYLNNTVIPAGETAYLIVTANIKKTAANGHTIKIDGSANPVAVGYVATTPTVTNNQTDIAGTQTIKAPIVTYSSETIAPTNIQQGSIDNPIYSLKIVAGMDPVTLDNLQVTTSGTYIPSDIDGFNVYVNSTNSVAGASFVRANFATTTGNGETILFNYLNNTVIPAGETAYLIVTANIKKTATDGHTIKINGSANPIAVGYVATSPTVTNNQTDIAGLQTIKAPIVTYSSETIVPANILQGSIDNPIYSLKIVAGVDPVTLDNVQVTTSGTYIAADIDGFNVYVNTTNAVAGASFVRANFGATTGSGETILFNYLNNTVIPAGETAYLIVTANIKKTATDGHTIKINGSANPIAVGYVATSPTVTNNQTDIAGLQTIKAPIVTYSSETIVPANILQGSIDNPIYSLRIVAGVDPVTLDNVQVTTSGTYTPADIDGFNVYVNSTNSVAGASFVRANFGATTGSGETILFNYLNNTVIPAGETAYLIVTANIKPTATDGHTIKIDGSANAIAVGYVGTTPIVTNNQTNAAGKLTIGTPSFNYSTIASSAEIIARGTSNHPFYTLKLQLGGTGATITSIAAKTSGNYNSTDISSFSLYKNADPGIAGATLLSTDVTSTGAGETLLFDTGYLELDANATTYFILRANINANATAGHTFQMDGGADPVIMSNSGVAATITNSQTNTAGIQTIGILPSFSPALVPITATTDAGLCNAVKTYSIGTRGYPVPTMTYVFTGATTGSGSGSGSGAVFNKGVTHVQLTLTNGCEPTPTITRSFDLTVSDAENPTITAPIAVSATTNTACTATGVTLGTPVTTDNCAVASVTNNAPTAFPLGNTTVTWTATDESGNTQTATQLVTVTDNILPTITAPASVNTGTNAGCTATAVSLGTPVTTDNCSVASVTNNAPSAFPLGATTVIWTVTDGSGNTKTASQTVTVNDNTLPIITPPANITATANENCTSTDIVLGTATATDNCTVNPVITNNAPATFPVGITTVTWTATDGAGNTKTANQTVTVNDNTLPIITPPANVTATANENCTSTDIVLGTATATDNCTVNPAITNNAPATFPVGVTTVTWTATDGAGNTNTTTQTVTVTDVTPPAKPVLADVTGSCTVTPEVPTTTDACAGTIQGTSTTSFPITTVGTTVVVWTFTDNSGNTVTSDQNIIVTGSNEIAMSNTSASQDITTGENLFYDSNCKLVSKLTAGTLSGPTTSNVWIESSNITGPYVKRHYQITPATNADGATATVTLYFTQTEFDDYSAFATSAQLPANATDDAGKANLRIAKFPGSSTDAGGLIYNPATPESINPLDSDINFVNDRWEVTFSVTGFSGFFVNSIFTPLPVTLVSFTGKRTDENTVTLAWITSDEKAFNGFEIQKSINAKSFETVGTVAGQPVGNTVLKAYQFIDRDQSDSYYRLKMVDNDGSFAFSKMVHIGSSLAKSVVGQLYPNPAGTEEVFIDVFANETGNWSIRTYQLAGRLLSTQTRFLQKGMNKVKITMDKTIYGTSLIQLESKGQVEVRKVIRP